MIDDHIYIPVTIRGETRLWIFDSGTNSNCVDLEYARRLGLVPEGELQARGASGKFAASFVTLPACSLPGIRFESQKIPAFPMRGLFRRQAGLEVAGILGYDFISRFVTRLDFSGSRLSFFDPDTFAYRGAGRVLAAPLHRNFLTVQVTVDGRYTGRFYLDSGSHKLEFHYPFAMQHGFLKRPGVDVMGSGAGGDSR